MLIKRLKKYAAIFGLTASVTLTSGCNFVKKDEIIGKLEKKLSDVRLDKVNKEFDKIFVDYDYEDIYLTDNNLNTFINTDKYDSKCVVELISNDIDTLVRGIIDRIEKNSSNIADYYPTDSNLYVVYNYNEAYKYSGNKTYFKILYDMLYSMFENTDKEEWDQLYCKLANTAIVYSDNYIKSNRLAQTEYLKIDNKEYDLVDFTNMIVIDENKIESIALEKIDETNFLDVYMNLFCNNLLHELEHSNQSNCPCYYRDYPELFFKRRLIDFGDLSVRTEFLSESGAVINSDKYVLTSEFLEKFNITTSYTEEIKTSNLLESSIFLRSDYKINDIYDNLTISDNKRLCNWFEIKEDEYDKLYNILTVLNITNSNNQDAFNEVIGTNYTDSNKEKAHRMLVRSDAVIDLAIYSYKNLIKFNEENNLSKDTFNYLVEKYQNYYLNEAMFVDNFTGQSYWSSEFREKFDLANEVVNEYSSKKYKFSDSFSEEDKLNNIEDELSGLLGKEKYDFFMKICQYGESDIRLKYKNSSSIIDSYANFVIDDEAFQKKVN